MEHIFNNIGDPLGVKKLNNIAGINKDIIIAVNSSFIDAVKQTKKISNQFKGSTPLKTCENIWNFLKNNILYLKDPEGYQFIKQPRKFLKDRSGDCKSFSLFTAAVLKNIYPNANIFLRYASYSTNNIPTHVYTIFQDEKETIIIDAVYKWFNKQKEYKFKIDYKMKVYTLAGIEETETINGRGRIKAAIKKATGAVKAAVSPQQQAQSSAPKRLKDKLKGLVKKTIQGGKKVGFAPARAAFLGLLELNLKGLATKLSAAAKQDNSKLVNIWKKVGGDPSQLQKHVEKGSKRKSIGDVEEIEGIGAVTAAAAATAVAAAAPIIILFVDMLKKMKKTPEMAEGGDLTALETEATSNLSAEGVSPEEAREAANAPDSAGGGLGMDPKTMMLLGGGAIALFLLRRNSFIFIDEKEKINK